MIAIYREWQCWRVFGYAFVTVANFQAGMPFYRLSRSVKPFLNMDSAQSGFRRLSANACPQ